MSNINSDVATVLSSICKSSKDLSVTRFVDSATQITYYASADEYMTIMNWYCRKVLTVGDTALTLCEAPYDPPVILAFRFNVQEDVTPIIDSELLCQIAFLTCNVLRAYVNESSDYDPLTCFVTETDTRELTDTNTTQSCTDINFTFPYTTCSRAIIKNEIIEKIKVVLSDLSYSYGNSTADYVINSIVQDYTDYPLPLLGSNIEGDVPIKYFSVVNAPTKSYNAKGYSLVPWSEATKLYSPYHNMVYTNSNYKDDLFLGTDLTTWSPLVASCSYWYGRQLESISPISPVMPRSSGGVNAHEKEINDTIKDQLIVQFNDIPQDATTATRLHNITNFEFDAVIGDDNKFNIIQELLPLIHDKMLVNAADSKVIGEAIFDATDGGERGRAYWIRVTTEAMNRIGRENCPEPFRSEDVENMCRLDWYSFRYDRSTYRSVGFMARQCDPVGYNSWHRRWCKPALETATSGLDFDLASAFYREYWLDFTCTLVGKSSYVWYSHEKHRLRETANGHTLRILMSTDFAARFRTIVHDLTATDPNRTRQDDEKIDAVLIKIAEILKGLKSRKYKNLILSEAADRFVRMDLGSKLDSNPDILGAPNGVFVTTDYDISFRSGRLEDFVTKSIGPMYDKDFANSPMIDVLDKWIAEVFDFDQEVIDYFWMYQASMMRGVNRSKKIFCLEGEKANNSKSSIMRAHEEMYGDYCVKIPATKLSMSNNNPEGPSPVMASTVGARSVLADEPNRNKDIRADVVKVMTSDTYTQRKLHENGGKARPLFTLTIVTNFTPNVDEKNEAMRTRLVIIVLDTVYSEKAPESYEEQRKVRIYKADNNWDDKAPRFAPAFLAKCVEYYPRVAKEGLRNPPEKIRKSTERYWNERDFYCRFLNECTISTNEEKQTVTLNELHENFTAWFRNYSPSAPIPPFDEFRCEIYQRWSRSPTNDDVWTHKVLKAPTSKNAMGTTLGFQSFNAAPADPMFAMIPQQTPLQFTPVNPSGLVY